MYRFYKIITITLLIILTIQPGVVASENSISSSKPTIGVESSNPTYGNSIVDISLSANSTSSLFFSYYCSITNTGEDLYLEGSTAANRIADRLSLILILQKWDGYQWVDVQSWQFTKYNAPSLTDGVRTSYQHGNYYRTRAVHFVAHGSEYETRYSTSSYIYVA